MSFLAMNRAHQHQHPSMTANTNGMHTMSCNSIPVFVVLQSNGEDDVDSVISFGTGTSSFEDFGDSESRWALESVAAHCRQHHHTTLTSTCTPTSVKRPMRASTSSRHGHGNTLTNSTNKGPHFPQRSLSLSGNSSPSPTSPIVRKPLARQTRLTRMAERAKAVARTPISRKLSFHHRHSLPAIPLRRKSSNSRSRGGCSCCSGSLTASSDHSSSNKNKKLVSRCGRLSNSCRIPIRRNNSNRIPTRRNSVQCVTTTLLRNSTTAIVLTTTTTTTTQENPTASRNKTRRATTGCFQIANTPPRLPQRYPSEVLLTTSPSSSASVEQQ
ncbi:expressed unknown protein [Seminavis robusta]|uniref:Uncharacterized protein n=1 Tax=Seminavis robusta TaxID=568900 RepID=A0A9N8HH51_9STRA|nr:expressed unknown protein [Seminavis robusta]|eukprot:Sro683_g186600.1 n/a (327) ;mRNA; f:5250-6230